MTMSIFLRLACAVAVAVSITAQRTSVQAQQRSGTTETEKFSPSTADPTRIASSAIGHSSRWRNGRGAVPTVWPSTGTASPFGRRTVARRELPRAASAPR